MVSAADYDPRYLAGILFFNARDFFEAHEVWEELWNDCAGEERRFYQALIQAAVALFHFGNGNTRGASRLFHSSRDYMKPFGPTHRGLDTEHFWAEMEKCFAGIIEANEQTTCARPDELIPTIELRPTPEAWPDPEEFLRED